MRKKKSPPLDQCELTATIETFERSYYISEELSLRRVDDEAILTITGTVETISTRYKRHQGKSIEMTFVCARSFSRDEAQSISERPFLCSVNLRGGCSVMAYLPSDAFWSLPEMIASKSVTHIEVWFGVGRRGYTELESVHFTTHVDVLS